RRSAELGDVLRAKVTASKAGAHAGTAQSAPTDSVAKGVFVTTTAPVVSGTAQVDALVGATSPTIKPATSLQYQWLANGVPVDGATDPTFTPTADQLDSVLKLK